MPKRNAHVYIPKGVYNKVHFIKDTIVILQTRKKTNDIIRRMINCNIVIHWWERNALQPHAKIWMNSTNSILKNKLDTKDQKC